mmetsp:Transcript_62244/g.148304  ORF Transcript_62244/g.148304 Transcript_62244/m.148304 type:complete len:233 (+) Transcript_62244:473-1171(+)
MGARLGDEAEGDEGRVDGVSGPLPSRRGTDTARAPLALRNFTLAITHLRSTLSSAEEKTPASKFHPHIWHVGCDTSERAWQSGQCRLAVRTQQLDMEEVEDREKDRSLKPHIWHVGCDRSQRAWQSGQVREQPDVEAEDRPEDLDEVEGADLLVPCVETSSFWRSAKMVDLRFFRLFEPPTVVAIRPVAVPSAGNQVDTGTCSAGWPCFVSSECGPLVLLGTTFCPFRPFGP